MRRILLPTVVLAGLLSCKTTPKELEWSYSKTIALEDVNPIGITLIDDTLYLSDGDHNRVVEIDDTGKTISSIDNLQRPMHLEAGSYRERRSLYIPEYGKDSIAIWDKNHLNYLVIQDSLDAPAGISVSKNQIAIADFYNNRILFYNGTQWMSIGTEGKELGQLYYPTDVQIVTDKIYVADAYNHRGQVFDLTGTALATFGSEQKINAATGIFVNENFVALTDFENNKVHIYDPQYRFLQTLSRGIAKPTDVYINDQILYVTNYRKGELIVYELKSKSNE